ncbi:MAG: hypothetical protein WA624_10745, partial [Methylocella sp.]
MNFVEKLLTLVRRKRLGGLRVRQFVISIINWHSPDNRECAKRVSLISCRDIGHSSYTGIIFRIARLLRLR